MPLLRRAVPAEPRVVARLGAVLPDRVGWVPPGADPPAAPSPGEVGRGRHAARRGSPTPLPPVDDRAVPPGPTEEPVAEAGGDAEGGSGAAGGGWAGGGRAGGRPGGAGSVLDRWRAGRVDPGRRGLAVLAAVALIAAGLAAFVVLRARPEPVAPPGVVATGVPVPGSSAAAAGATPGTSAVGTVVVSVAGLVAHPGLLRLPIGSRVDDALRAAGGAAPGADLTGLNPARRLVDGEQLLVGVPAVAEVPGGSAGVGADALVDLNSATLAQLDSLPGIGPVLAQKLLDWRTEHGRFGSVDQLREVSGIGESKYAELKDKVRV